MSLLSTASLWTNDDNNNETQPRKRIPSMRKTVKLQPILKNTISSSWTDNNSIENLQSSSLDDMTSYNTNKENRINELVNKLTREDGGNKLENFAPMPNPNITNKQDDVEIQNNNINKFYSNDLLPLRTNNDNVVEPTTKQVSFSGINLGNYSNLESSYPNTISSSGLYKPTSSLSGHILNDIRESSDHNIAGKFLDNKLLEKVNYMIHLMEQQKSDKTNSITEEFILYVFLGVFMIFTIDSFTRVGKYTR
jgi:hypothetical protein